jgi:oxalate decarboxylase/phosphoglucose isomerase-like protein (cupin superfamily)
VVEIPPGYVHSVQNTGAGDMVMVIWANQIFDPINPDTYPMEFKSGANKITVSGEPDFRRKKAQSVSVWGKVKDAKTETDDNCRKKPEII